MAILTIPAAMLRRLAGYAHADTSADTELGYVLADEQLAHEYALDANALAASLSDAGLSAVLVLGVAQLVAGSYLQQQGRAAGALDDVALSGLTISPNGKHDIVSLGDLLVQQGAARLAPYAKKSNSVATGSLSPALGFGLSIATSSQATTAVTTTTAPGDGVTSGAFSSNTTANSLFGVEASAAIGTDDSDPPAEFASGYASVSDPAEANT